MRLEEKDPSEMGGSKMELVGLWMRL